MNLAVNDKSQEVAFMVSEREMKLLVGCALWVEGIRGEGSVEDIDQARELIFEHFTLEELAQVTEQALDLAEAAGMIQWGQP